MKFKKRDKTGEKHGRWSVIRIHDDKRYLCLCDCGTERLVLKTSLIKTGSASCGCLQREVMAKKQTTHGLYHHPLHSIWNSMKNRCYDVNQTGYKNWGGRGITVCDEWRNDFTIFYKWALENGWRKGLALDRKKTDGNYEPSNCRFITQKENNRNRRGLGMNMMRARVARKLKQFGYTNKRIADLYFVGEHCIQSLTTNKTWV